MKNYLKIFYLLFILTIGFIALRKGFISKNSSSSPTPPPAYGEGENLDNLQKIKWDDKEYAISIIKVQNISLFKLLPNFTEKLTASDAKEKYACNELISGGFYLEDSTPTGLFISEGKVIKNWIKNNLLNGVLSVNDFDTPRITFEVPKDHLRIALQTGPVLIENAKILKLSLIKDDPARRVVGAITGDNTLYFLIIYNENQVFDGPFLKDMPNVISEIQKDTGIVFADAINLDGGSASAFYSDEVNLAEMSPVGSFFCIKKN